MVMPRALTMVRQEPHYRADAVRVGLKAAGFEVVKELARPGPRDLLVCWNRYGLFEAEAQRFEAAGAAVVIMENGIIGKTQNTYAKQFDANGEQLFTLALNFHNGPGAWFVGAPGRWRQQGVEVLPWRETGENVLLCGQRGFGNPRVAPPPGWLEKTAEKLRKITHRPIVIRQHPGNEPAKVPLADDLEDAYAVVVHGSACGIHGMAAGIRCYSTWSEWIGFPCALPFSEIGRADVNPTDEARERMLDRVAWAQWPVCEIAAGEPFRLLMELHEKETIAA
jgi:hypothetical protein